MPASMATVDAILKEIYGPRIENQLQEETVALKRIERTSEGVVETVGGKYVDFPIRVGRNHGMGYRNENQKLPKAGNQKYAEVHVPLKYGYGRVRLTGQVMQLAEKNYQAFASAMDREMDGSKTDILKDENRIIYGDGTGLLASITSANAASADHDVDDPRLLEVGMFVDVVVRTTGAAGQLDTEIVAINGNTVTFADAFDGAATQGIYREGSWEKEPTGLDLIVDDTRVLHGVDPAVQPKWAGLVRDNGGVPRALSEGLMIETCDLTRQRGAKVSLILTSLGVRRSYFNLLSQQRRYTDTKEFAGGLRGLAFHYGTEIPVVEDPDHPPEKMYFLAEDKIKVYRNKEWHWADEDGSVLKWVTDFDAWEGILRQYSEKGTSQRNAHSVLTDVIEG